VVRFPFHAQAYSVAGLAIIVMLGNELQDEKLGYKRVNALGQAPHQLYVLAPERLATVAVGLVIGYFWTIIPYPLSDHTELRHDLAATLFLLARYYSMVCTTVTARTLGDENLMNRNRSRLAKERTKCFSELHFLTVRMRTHLTFSKFQVVLGGQFPKDKYSEMINLCEEVRTASAVIGYASTSFMHALEDARVNSGEANLWLNNFRRLLGTVDTVTTEMTGTLVLLSNHMMNATPFAPNINAPEAFKLAHSLERMQKDMLEVRHVVEPGYAAFVTTMLAGRGINRSVERLIE